MFQIGDSSTTTTKKRSHTFRGFTIENVELVLFLFSTTLKTLEEYERAALRSRKCNFILE